MIAENKELRGVLADCLVLALGEFDVSAAVRIRTFTEDLEREGPWTAVAYATGDARDLFSARIGCQTFQPVYGIDLGVLCLRR